MTTKNLGLVKAICVGTTPPQNTVLLWYDDNIGEKLHKYFDVVSQQWLPLRAEFQNSESITSYQSISGVTNVAFPRSMQSNDYFVEILQFISGSVQVKSGWIITNKQSTGFRFDPNSSRYNSGILYYRVTLFEL